MQHHAGVSSRRQQAVQDSRLVKFSSSTTPRSPGWLRPQLLRLRHRDSTTTP